MWLLLKVVMALQVCLVRTQVNKEIYELEDLLAVESSNFQNDVNPNLIPIEPPPPGFGGDRLTGAPIQNTPGGQENIIYPDGSYSFG